MYIKWLLSYIANMLFLFCDLFVYVRLSIYVPVSLFELIPLLHGQFVLVFCNLVHNTCSLTKFQRKKNFSYLQPSFHICFFCSLALWPTSQIIKGVKERYYIRYYIYYYPDYMVSELSGVWIIRYPDIHYPVSKLSGLDYPTNRSFNFQLIWYLDSPATGLSNIRYLNYLVSGLSVNLNKSVVGIQIIWYMDYPATGLSNIRYPNYLVSGLFGNPIKSVVGIRIILYMDYPATKLSKLSGIWITWCLD